jgi:hypothetical protein
VAVVFLVLPVTVLPALFPGSSASSRGRTEPRCQRRVITVIPPVRRQFTCTACSSEQPYIGPEVTPLDVVGAPAES